MKPELSKNQRNSRFSPEKRYFLNFSSCTLYFFMKFCTLMRNGNIWNVTEPDFRKTFFFRPKMPEICRKKRFFGIFSRFRQYFLLILCSKMRNSNIQNMAEPDFFKRNFFPAENTGNLPEIAVFAHFHWTFSVYFLFFT